MIDRIKGLSEVKIYVFATTIYLLKNDRPLYVDYII